MAMIEVDLEAGDPAQIISSAAVDQDFWNANTSAATAYAMQHGLTVDAGDYAPDAGTVSQNVLTMSDWQAWVQSTSELIADTVGGKAPTAGSAPAPAAATTTAPAAAPVPTSGESSAIIVFAVVGTVAGAALLYWLFRKR